MKEKVEKKKEWEKKKKKKNPARIFRVDCIEYVE